MGLIHHIPLNVNFPSYKNLGTLSDSVTATNITESTDLGILGYGYIFNTSGTSNVIVNNSYKLTKNMSFSCWVYFNTLKNCFIIDMRNSSGQGFQPMYYGGASGIQFYSSGTTTGGYLSLGGALTAKKWYHIAVSMKNGVCSAYLNGVYKSSITVSVPDISAPPITIGARYNKVASTAFDGMIQDVRVYDHALSNKEVYDLSKGLMVHFKMNSDSIGVTTNIDQCKSAMINKSLSNFSNGNGCATATFGNYYGHDCFQIKIYKESITSWTGVYLNFNPLSYGASVGDTVIRSCWMYVPSGQTAPGHFTESIEGNSTGKTYKQYDLTKCNTWQRIWLKGTISDTSTNNYLHYFMAMSSGSVNFTFYIRDFQAEINSSITQYTSGTRTEGDISVGLYNIEATPYGSITINNDSIIGKNSVSFEGTKSFLELPNFKPKLPNEPYTIAFWIYSRENKTRDVYFGNHANSSQTFNIERTASNYLRIYYNSDTPIGVISTIEIPGSEWVHIAIAFDGTTFYAYKNGGEKKYSKALSTTLNCTNTTYRIGSDYRSAQTTSEATRFNGLMTDFRIYATCLSENDIKSIYSTRKTIDRFGSICVTDVEEDETIASSQVLSNGVQKTPYISEIVELDDGSKWIQIMHHDTKKATNLFSSGDAVLTKSVFKNSDCWCDFPLINEIGLYDSKYEFFLVQEKYNGKFTRYRWSQTVNPITATFSNTKYNSTGITQIENMPSTYGGMYKSATGKTFFNMNNNTDGNWYGAIACYTSWSQTVSSVSYIGTPGIADSDSAVAVGVIDLWMRIDPANAKYRELRGGVVLTNRIYEE